MNRPTSFLIASLVVTLAPAARAADGAGPVSFELEVGAVSDYRFRGLSLTDGKPALQAGLTATLANGAYGYVWASQIDEYGAGDDGEGAQAEVDLVAGWAGSVAGFDIDASLQAYRYPGGSRVNYVEIPVSVARTVGAWHWTLGMAYAPAQEALGDEDNLYGWGGVRWSSPALPVELSLTAGFEDGAYAPGGKWDWTLGLSHAFGPVTVGAAYVDSDSRDSGSALVASLTATF